MLDVNGIVARYRALPPPAKQLLLQHLTPDVLRVLVQVLGPDFVPVAQQFMQQGAPQPQMMAPQPPPSPSAFGDIA